MSTGIEVKNYKLKALPNKPIPNAILYIKADGDSAISTYITDVNGIPYPLKDDGGIKTITNTDGTITITGTDNVVINLSNSVKAIINSALQSGDNISELVNDVSYITLADVPDTDLQAIASPTQVDITNNNGTDAVLLPATTINSGVLLPQDKIQLDNLPSNLQKKLNLPTGFIEGLQLSVNVDNTKFNIASGFYTITDFTDLANPTVTIKTYAGLNGITPNYLLTSNASYIALDINGNIIQSASPFTNSDRRTLAIVGAVIHSNHVNINVTNEIKAPIVAAINQLHDFMKAVGFLNEEGNVYGSNGANLMINKSIGKIFGMGINASNYLNPHELSIAAQTALTFRYRLRDGTEFADTTFINPNSYDNNGVLTATGAGNKWTIQHINLFQSGLTRIQYGQTIYTSFNNAVIGLPTDPFVTEQNIADNAVFRSYLIIKQGVTDISAAISGGDALFVPVDKFGNVIGNGSVALTFSSIIGALGYTPENVANKAINFSIVNDILYPSVKATKDYVDSKVPQNYSKIVYVNTTTPTTATIFDLNNPPVVNDNSLKTDVNNLYIGTDASTWVYITSPSGYITKTVTSGTSNFYLSGTVIDAGGNKNTAIERLGTVGGAQGTANNHFITKFQLDHSKTELSYACSDELSDLMVGTLITFRMPVGLTLTNVKLSLNTAPSISKVIVDIKKNGTTIFSTLISVDTSSTTSVGASVPAVISDSNLIDDSIITISTTQVGSGATGKGLKVTLIGNRI